MNSVRDIQRDIISVTGGAGLSQADVAKYLGINPKTAAIFLEDIPFCMVSKRKIYLAKDIAKKLFNSRF